MVQKPGEHHAVWHFWNGEEREFTCWYINLQMPFRRTKIGYDTQDLELDFIVHPDNTWEIKDVDLVFENADQGRWSLEEAREIMRYGHELEERLQKGERWWDKKWATWRPEGSWEVLGSLPPGWNQVDFISPQIKI